ncbi:MAG TPA: iron ABC transporter permease [Flexilinea sp.]|nr:iron ABC transporter permease [Flexilinea sp.]
MIQRNQRIKLIALTGILILCLFLSIFAGRYPELGFLSPATLKEDTTARNIFFNLRIPRIILGLLLGMALGSSGLFFQTVFNNPLVDSGMLGVTQGASFGAAIGIVFFHSNPWIVQLLAIGLGMSGLFLSVVSARKIHYGGWTLRLILAGSVISALFGAGLSLLKVLADSRNQLHAIEFWLMGSLGFTIWQGLPLVIVITCVCLFILWKYRWRINLLALDSEVASSLGVRIRMEQMLLMTAAVFAVSAATSLSGIIGWVGLIVPHLSRRLFGSDTQYSLPGSMLIGAILILACDNGARILSPSEIPLGIITSFVGVIIFILLMGGKKK